MFTLFLSFILKMSTLLTVFPHEAYDLNILYSAPGKTFQLYSHNLIGLFEQLKKPGLAAQFQTHRFPDRIIPRWGQYAWGFWKSCLLPHFSATLLTSLLFSLQACCKTHAVLSFCSSLSTIMTNNCICRGKGEPLANFPYFGRHQLF